jgi:hypothetical protein
MGTILIGGDANLNRLVSAGNRSKPRSAREGWCRLQESFQLKTNRKNHTLPTQMPTAADDGHRGQLFGI